MFKTKLKKGDNVKVMVGKSKGHIGRIISMSPNKGVAFVEGANIVSRHTKPNSEYPEGGIIKKEGPKALYKGLGASNIGIIPYAGVDLAMYGTLKASWLKRNKDKEPQWYDLLLMGSLSSFT